MPRRREHRRSLRPACQGGGALPRPSRRGRTGIRPRRKSSLLPRRPDARSASRRARGRLRARTPTGRSAAATRRWPAANRR
ncbi:MAG: hypothetical protein C6Y20_04955 [Tagaea sp. CACIAM 22H2]|nr:hypothetical protein [Tagaea sp. CACIAM 22H2]